MKFKPLIAWTLAVVGLGGCSSKTEVPKAPQVKQESAKPREENPKSPSPEVVKAVPPVEPTSPVPVPAPTPAPVAATPPSEPPASPYEGLEAEQVAMYRKIEKLMEPGLKGLTGAFGNLKEEERRAKAVMLFGSFKISLNPVAEKRLRATLGEVENVENYAASYIKDITDAWVTAYGFTKVYPVRDLLRVAYEKALDSGAEFPPEIRRTLGEMLRSDGPNEPTYELSLTDYAKDLRPKLLEQSVAGDHIYVFAYAVRERGEYIMACREWMRKYATLVTALPEKARNELLVKAAWGNVKEWEVDKTRWALMGVHPSFLQFLRGGQAPGLDTKRGQQEHPVIEVREAFLAREGRTSDDTILALRKAFVATEAIRRKKIETYFSTFDVRSWELLLAYDRMLAEFQKMLDEVTPDLTYRFRPLLPLESPKGAEENTLKKIDLPGTVMNRVPTIELSETTSDLVFSSPAGSPKLQELLKAGQVFEGTLRLVLESDSEVVWNNSELTVKSVDEKRKIFCDLHVPKSTSNEAEMVVALEGEVKPGGFSLEGKWKLNQDQSREIELHGNTDKGFLSGVLSTFGSGGHFWFEPKN